MKRKPKYIVGESVQILIGPALHTATVVEVGEWSHSSGNRFPVYTVEFSDGKRMCCGDNSLTGARAR